MCQWKNFENQLIFGEDKLRLFETQCMPVNINHAADWRLAAIRNASIGGVHRCSTPVWRIWAPNWYHRVAGRQPYSAVFFFGKPLPFSRNTYARDRQQDRRAKHRAISATVRLVRSAKNSSYVLRSYMFANVLITYIMLAYILRLGMAWNTETYSMWSRMIAVHGDIRRPIGVASYGALGHVPPSTSS